jgi:hypothetical protein
VVLVLVKTADGGGGGGDEDRATAEAETTRTPTGIQNTFLSADCWGYSEPQVMALDVRHMQLPIRPSSMPASKVTFPQLWLVSYAGRWKGGQGAWSDGRHLGVLLTTRVGRAGAVPLATQGYPTTKVGREWKQRFEGAVEFQRDYDRSRAVSN